ncbi:hypothetical protein SUDANB23_06782 (plasmid) [Streptomyces sp. enrichment culture]
MRTSWVPSSHTVSHTALVIWVWLRRSVRGMPRNRANALTSILGVAAGGTLMNSTGLLPSWPGCRRASAGWKERPSAIIVVVLPVVAGPGMIRPRRAPACRRRLSSSLRRAVNTLSMAGVRMTASGGVVVLALRLGPGAVGDVTRGRRGSVDEASHPCHPVARVSGVKPTVPVETGLTLAGTPRKGSWTVTWGRLGAGGPVCRAGWGVTLWCVFSRPDAQGAVVGQGLLVVLAVVRRRPHQAHRLPPPAAGRTGPPTSHPRLRRCGRGRRRPFSRRVPCPAAARSSSSRRANARSCSCWTRLPRRATVRLMCCRVKSVNGALTQGVADPRHRFPPVPARLVRLRQPYPDPAGSVRVAVDLPQAVRRRRMLAAVGVWGPCGRRCGGRCGCRNR